ncbi:MAG TPA: LacI family DNA-binding transcriptional regulator [Pseudonocardiaceae bacterium]|jgi:DNA-binding LacI/PurR family transcriptional regulator|nr:LacI family DNA-binding transcriptional regulator [Pseudonocardiaceae bacterium]
MASTRPTITTVAARANVSRQTVSNVLNAPHRVQAGTRERVEAAIVELGYRPHRAARQLRTHRSNLIAMRMAPFSEELAGSVLDRFVHAVTESAQGHGFRTLVFTATNDTDEISTYADLLNSYELDAFILTGTHHRDRRTTWLRKQGVPFVTFGRPWGVRAKHWWVDVDGKAGTTAATERLLDAGHRRIGFVGWPVGSGVGDDRRAGWETTLRAAGVDPNDLTTSTENTVDEGRSSAVRLVREQGADALLCASDTLALGALAMVRDRVSRGGTALPVIGFDDSPSAAAMGLTTVAQPLREAATTCVDLLTSFLDRSGDPDEAAAQHHVLLAPQLVVRQSG